MFNNNGRSPTPPDLDALLDGIDPAEVAGDLAKGYVAQAPANAFMLRSLLDKSGAPVS